MNIRNFLNDFELTPEEFVGLLMTRYPGVIIHPRRKRKYTLELMSDLILEMLFFSGRVGFGENNELLYFPERPIDVKKYVQLLKAGSKRTILLEKER